LDFFGISTKNFNSPYFPSLKVFLRLFRF